jgi:hypothetical protein
LPHQACGKFPQNLRGDNAALAKSRFGGAGGLDLIEKENAAAQRSTTNQINKSSKHVGLSQERW